MKQNYKMLTAIFVFISFIFTVFLSFNVNASSVNAEYNDALKNAPRGINLYDVMTVGNFRGNGSFMDQATNPDSLGTGIAVVTNQKSKQCAIWSNPNYAFDLNKDQKLSMWLNFGDSKNPGDGMAFVLQNDSSGTGAYAGKGESMNVWAVDRVPDQGSTAVIANSAISNSLAIEFDTYVDNNNDLKHAGTSTSFDTGIANGDQYIAWNYPGDINTYNQFYDRDPLAFFNKKYWYSMNHNDFEGDLRLTDGKWHHLTIVWDKKDQTLKYSFNDKNMDGSDAEYDNDNFTKTIKVDKSKFNSDNDKLIWGFTGTSNASTQNNFVVMETVPSDIYTESNITVHNDTYGDDIGDNGYIGVGNRIPYSYNLNYKEGGRPWKDISASIPLPNNVALDKFQVSYPDGSVQNIDLNNIDSKNQMDFKLDKPMKKSGDKIQVNLSGIVVDTASKQDFKIKSGLARFYSSDNVETIGSPTIDVVTSKNIQLIADPIDDENQTINFGEDAQVRGKFSYTNSLINGFKNSDFNLYTSLNDGEIVKNDITDAAPTGTFKYVIKSKDLKLGDNKLDVFVRDKTTGVSNEITYNIKVTRTPGTLKFGEVSIVISILQS
ncbi:lectin-like domain-containing protein [Lactobacillus terrae]|uniref:lectin-like domain-containing protein n=1 Tax=Lactobacillus terrae TaxID=2269374 RepID=UPI000C1B762B|nr:hypothetical protein [Lactobacillus terrae]